MTQHWRPDHDALPDYVVQVGDIAKCRGARCGKDVGWAKTREGRWQPFDLRPDPETGKHAPHHATCPDAGSFRKRRKTT